MDHIPAHLVLVLLPWPGSVNSIKMHVWNHVCLSIDLNAGWMMTLVSGEVVQTAEEERGEAEG